MTQNKNIASSSLSALTNDNILPQELTNSQRVSNRFKIHFPVEIMYTNVVLSAIYSFGLLNYSLTSVAIVENTNFTWKLLYFSMFWCGKAFGGVIVILWRIVSSFSLYSIECFSKLCMRRKYSIVQDALLNSSENGNIQTSDPLTKFESSLYSLNIFSHGNASLSSYSTQTYSSISQSSVSSSCDSPTIDSVQGNQNSLNVRRRSVLISSILMSILANFSFILFRNLSPRYTDPDNIPNYNLWTMIVCRVLLGVSHGVNTTVIREHFSRMKGEIQSGVVSNGNITSPGIDYTKWRVLSLGIFSVFQFLSFALAPGLGLLHEYLGKKYFPNVFCPAPSFSTHDCKYPFFSAFTLMSIVLLIIGIILIFFTCFIKTVFHRSTSIKRIMDPKIYKLGWIKIKRYRVVRFIIVGSWICVTITLTYCGIVFNSMDNYIDLDMSTYEGLGIALLLIIPSGTLLTCCILILVFLTIRYLLKKRKLNDNINSEIESGKLLPPQAENIVRSKSILRYKALAICLMCLLMAGYGVGIMSIYSDTEVTKIILQGVFSGMISALLPLAFTVSWHSFYTSLDNFFRKPSRFFLPFFTIIEAVFSFITISVMVRSNHPPNLIFIFGFITLIIGLFCMALIIFLSVTNVVGVIVMHHGNRDLQWKDGAITAVKNFKIKTFFSYLIDKKFPLGLDTRNRITIGFPSKPLLEEAVLFHRCFQHHNLLRLKGHWINPGRKEFNLLYDELDLEKYNLISLKQYYDENIRTTLCGFDSFFKWNHKLDIAINITSIIAELHDSFCCHGHLSSWNVLLFISKKPSDNRVKKIKLAYLGQGESQESSNTPWKKQEISSMTDINDIGLLLLELFLEQSVQESSLFQLLKDDRECDVPYSAIKECPPDVTDFNQSYRITQWKKMQKLMMDCWEPIPKISCRTIIKKLKNTKLVKNVEEEEEELLPSER